MSTSISMVIIAMTLMLAQIWFIQIAKKQILKRK